MPDNNDTIDKLLDEARRTHAESSEKVKRLNKLGLIAVLFMMIPVVHYISIIAILFIANKMLKEHAKAEFNRGYVIGFETAAS